MTRKCFFIDEIDSNADIATLRGQTAHHVDKVLRLKAGDSVELRDGLGNGWLGVIARVEGGAVHVQLVERQAVRTESPLELTLGLGLGRADRMDLAVRQATELGAQRFVAFRAARSQYGLPGVQADKRRERWMRIAREAMCQCERMKVPEILVFSDISELVASISAWEEEKPGLLKLLAWEGEQEETLWSIRGRFPSCEGILAVIGPEGGWVQEEVDQFMDWSFHPVRLGPRTLRLETAAVSFLASAQLLWGDFGISR